MSRLGGLRGRLLVAFVFTSVLTLAVVGAIVLGPLQNQLRDRLIAAGWTETYVDTDGFVLQPNGLGPSGSVSPVGVLLESAR